MIRSHEDSLFLQGLLRFQYNLQRQGFSSLKVYSSSSRQTELVRREPVLSRYPRGHDPHELFVRYGEYSMVCDIMAETSGQFGEENVGFFFF